MNPATMARQPVRSKPPTQGARNIEAARCRARQDYHSPDNVYLLSFDTHCSDPHIAGRMHELYADRDQVQRHHNIFFCAKFRIPQLGYDEAGLPLDNHACELDEIYGRLLKLYEYRAEYIQETGMRRISLWSQWNEERMKPAGVRNDGFVTACTSTIIFLEEDFEKRKLDFVAEVYALLEKHDPERAKMVLCDLQAIWPWATINQIKFLERYTADYSHVPRRKHFAVRNSDWEQQ